MTKVCPSGDERVLLFGQLLETNARLTRAVNAELEDSCELPLAWFEALLTLRRTPEGRLRMNEVADSIVLSNGGATRLVDRMEAAGLVERVNCPSDRRAIHVAITAQGNLKLDEALAVHLEQLSGLISSRLSDAERAQLSTLLGKLQRGV